MVAKEQKFSRLKVDMEELHKEVIALRESISDADADEQKAAQVGVNIHRKLLSCIHVVFAHI